MTEHYLLVGIVSIIVLGTLAQWLAWRLGLPSILLLLVFGFLVGPVTGFLSPDELLGELLFPIVSLAVAIILFEGGLSLKFSELQATGHVVRNLVTIGTLATWLLSAWAAQLTLGLDFQIALLFGAILVVTGPTVIIPLLRQIRTVGKISSIIKWEGIINDPIGAVLAVLVFEAILVSGVSKTASTIVTSLLETFLLGLIFGGAGALILLYLLQRHWIPDYLKNAVTLMVVIATFAISNTLQRESGLFVVTLLGMILANQKKVNVRPIVEFKEHLGVLLISSLFIILAARLKLEDLTHLGWGSASFLLILIVIVRPISVLLATLKSGLEWREKLFLACMAPRGIVAAAVTAIFALELAEDSIYRDAELLVPEMFLVIVGTVTVYGLLAAPIGRWLGLAQPNPQGVLLVGAHQWGIEIASRLQEKDFQVLLVDTNRNNLNNARLAGLSTFYASVLSEYILDEIELGSLGRMLALTQNDEVNSLAALQFTEVFERSEVYQLSPEEIENNRKETVSSPLRGRLLFNEEMTFCDIDNRFRDGYTIKITSLTEKFDYDTYREEYEGKSIPMFLISQDNGTLKVFATDKELLPQPGDSLIGLVPPQEENGSG